MLCPSQLHNLIKLIFIFFMSFNSIVYIGLVLKLRLIKTDIFTHHEGLLSQYQEAIHSSKLRATVK